MTFQSESPGISSHTKTSDSFVFIKSMGTKFRSVYFGVSQMPYGKMFIFLASWECQNLINAEQISDIPCFAPRVLPVKVFDKHYQHV